MSEEELLEKYINDNPRDKEFIKTLNKEELERYKKRISKTYSFASYECSYRWDEFKKVCKENYLFEKAVIIITIGEFLYIISYILK